MWTHLCLVPVALITQPKTIWCPKINPPFYIHLLVKINIPQNCQLVIVSPDQGIVLSTNYSRLNLNFFSQPPLSQSMKPLATSINVRPNMHRNPTQPPRHTDAHAGANSITIGVYTKPNWHATTEPGFITANKNSFHSGSKPQWQFTTEPGFVTRTKAKPSSFKPKPKPTKKPIQNTTKYGNKGSTTKTTTKRFVL